MTELRRAVLAYLFIYLFGVSRQGISHLISAHLVGKLLVLRLSWAVLATEVLWASLAIRSTRWM